jgi:acyl-CoA dehydrogenase
MKAHATYRLRESIDDAMDVHAGKAVIDGPLNYLGNLYRSMPVGITVEGANIVTRNLIIFGQGAIRCHPWLLKEILALENHDQKQALKDFDRAFWGHVGHSFATAWRAWLRSWCGAGVGPAPDEPSKTKRYYKRLSRYAAAFALASEMALAVMGGALKRKEMLSARFGDVLSELYLLSAVLKRWEDEGREEDDFPLVEYCTAQGFATIESRLDEIYRNFPSGLTAGFLRFMTMPFGADRRRPSDALAQQCADILLEPSATRDRLTAGIYLGQVHGDDGVSRLERAYSLVIEAAEAEKKLRDANISDWSEGFEESVITAEDADLVCRAREATDKVIEVDDFPPHAFARQNVQKAKEESLEPERRLLKEAPSGQ